MLAGQATATAKAGDGPVGMIRMFKLAKASAIKARTQAINQLKAVLVGADPVLREKLSGLSSTLLVRRCAELDAGASGSPNRLPLSAHMPLTGPDFANDHCRDGPRPSCVRARGSVGR